MIRSLYLRKISHIQHEAKIIEIKPVDESNVYDPLLTVDKVTQRCYINTGIELLDTMKTTNVDLTKRNKF